MPKNPKMIVCRTCNNSISAKAKSCPHCGAKNKKPIYKRGWFIALVVIIALSAIGSNGSNRTKSTGEKVSKYQGNDIISIEKPETTPPKTTLGTSDAPSASEPGATSGTLINGMRPEFKEAMDSYEAFYDEYCDFMEEYMANPTDLTLLSEYTDMLIRLSDMDEKFEAWEDGDLNNAELKYYLEVNNRITGKLLQVAS